jgi:hypothetical protein
VDGVKLDALIKPLGNEQYEWRLSGRGVNVSSWTSVYVGLLAGNNTGSAVIEQKP